MKKFLKDTRGVVMMEYIILGLFAVAITVASVHALGKVYNHGLIAMATATIGSTTATENVLTNAVTQLEADASASQTYGDNMVDKAIAQDTYEGFAWTVYED